MIVVPILAESMEEMLAEIATLDRQAVDGIELRLDHLRAPFNLACLRRAIPDLPTIVTCRLPKDGGRYEGEEGRRLSLLQEAVDLGFDYVDIEAECFHSIQRGTSPSRLIASIHNFTETPSDLSSTLRDLASLPCDIIKFSFFASDLRDNLRLFHALETAPKPAIGLCMGELGEVSRILNLSFGSVLTFGSLREGRESAPGQIPYRDLAYLYRVKAIRQTTARYGVVGNPIAHSMSPVLHNTAFAHRGLDAVYLRFRVSDFPLFLRELAEPLDLRGLSVTIPHKEAAFHASTVTDELAKEIGTVNTLTRIPAGWEGRNTDCEAALTAICRAAHRAGIDLSHAVALLVGAGGTARAIGLGLRRAGCRIVVANRTFSRGEALAQVLGGEAIAIDALATISPQIVVNATSVGMYPKVTESPVPASIFHPGMVAFDVVYNPRMTRFLSDAKEAGAEIADGVEMFVEQAARQFERWTGQPAPREVMESVVVQRLEQTPPLAIRLLNA